MERLLIKNGIVFDPINDIEGEKKDILIEDGRIADKFTEETDIKQINASNKTVIPAALDIHAHFASQQVNWGRLLGSNNQTFRKLWLGMTLENIARSYISNGYTFILEANVFPSLAKQTIFNFKQFPVLDKAMLLNVSNSWLLELEFQRGKIEEISIFLADLLKKSKGYGFKVYNPFEAEDWNFKFLREDITRNGRLYNFSPLDVYVNLTRANEYLGLPHSIHAHVEGYELEYSKKNLSTILEKINSIESKRKLRNDPKHSRSQIFHLAHASAYNIDGNNKEFVNFINGTEKIDLDVGFIGFDEINPLITSDRKLIEHELRKENFEDSNKLMRTAIETEGDSFITFRRFNIKNKAHYILWANAINLALNIKDKWKVQFSVNYPNYANISNVPKIATWLISADARNALVETKGPDIVLEPSLKENENNLTFNEFVIITRSGPAKSIGLGKIKGNLGVGADGDVNILNLNINEIDISKDYMLFKKALENIDHVIKSGKIIKLKDKIDLNPSGHIFWSHGQEIKQDKELVLAKKRDFFEKYYSIFYDSLNVNIDDHLLRKID